MCSSQCCFENVYTYHTHVPAPNLFCVLSVFSLHCVCVCVCVCLFVWYCTACTSCPSPLLCPIPVWTWCSPTNLNAGHWWTFNRSFPGGPLIIWYEVPCWCIREVPVQILHQLHQINWVYRLTKSVKWIMFVLKATWHNGRQDFFGWPMTTML